MHILSAFKPYQRVEQVTAEILALASFVFRKAQSSTVRIDDVANAGVQRLASVRVLGILQNVKSGS